ncbi:O-antigen ligase family protein [Piscinibacter sakaiensis]|uniref:O-antigen ligase family protein n=1 Tax=Piscinibacter sakaiensis TaxID=1547922 RepID=UPI003726D145
MLLFGTAALLAWTGRPQWLLVGAVFFTAPIDISKALVPPIAQFYSPGLYLTVGHVALLGLTLLWLARRLLVQRRLPPFGRADAAVLVFLALVWFGALRSPQGGLAIASALSYSLAVLAFYVASHAIDDPADWRMLLRASVAVVLVQAVWVALQFVTKLPLALPGSKSQTGGELRFGGEGFAFRPSGFLEHPNALADHMTLVIPVALALLLLGRRRLPALVWWAALLTLGAAAFQLLLSLSRGGWLSTVAGCLLVIAVYWRRGLVRTRQIAALAALTVVAVAVVIAAYPSILLRLTGGDDRALESRSILNNQALAIIRTAPLAGVGFGAYNRAAYETIAPAFALISPEYQQSLLRLVVHNHYLLLAAELGIPTAAYFALLLLAFLRLPWTVRRWQDPAMYALAIGLIGALLAQLIFLNSDNYYADIRVYLLWLMLGVLRGACRNGRRDEAAGDAEAGASAPAEPATPRLLPAPRG